MLRLAKEAITSYLYHTIAIEVSYDAVEFGVRRIQIHDLLWRTEDSDATWP